MHDQDYAARRDSQHPPRGFAQFFGGADGIVTRNHTLQGLISERNQSGTNLVGLNRAYRSSSVDLEHGPQDSDDEGLSLMRRQSNFGVDALITPQMRSMRLIGNTNPRYRWEKYIKTDEELKEYKKPL